MLNRIRLRPIERHDLPALLDIIRDARSEYGRAEQPDSRLAPADFAIFDTYTKRRTIYFVALLDGAVVGGAGIAPLPGSDPLACELQRMDLKREARGQGVETLLLDACLDAARRFWFVRCHAETIFDMNLPLKLDSRSGLIELKAPQEAM
jgi:putative acetyltransferase